MKRRHIIHEGGHKYEVIGPDVRPHPVLGPDGTPDITAECYIIYSTDAKSAYVDEALDCHLLRLLAPGEANRYRIRELHMDARGLREWIEAQP